MTQPAITSAISPSDDQLDPIIRAALAEDLGDGDVTTLNTIPADARLTGDFLVKAPGVLAGLEVAQRVFVLLDPAVEFRALVADGDRVDRGAIVAVVTGPGRAILSGERVALEPVAAHVGHRHRHAALCGRGGRHPRRDPGHAQDRPRPARAG